MTAELGKKHWYIVTTQSMRENKVAKDMNTLIDGSPYQEYFFNVLVAEQPTPVLKDGLPTCKTRMKNLYPGYIFVEMIMTDERWYLVRNTPGVTGIAGSSCG